uniref:dUTP diphosphatase n=1 Tax=viral metagenome TaxID=1070528 RepID=A0A6C0EPR4_9ZZZZ
MLNIDTDYFNIIDTDEKAYILGLVYKNDNYIIKLSNRTDIKSILSNICLNIDTNIIYIGNTKILKLIKSSILNFNNFSDECKKGFIRGLYESNNKTLIISEDIKEIFENIKDFILIDIKYEIIKNDKNEDVIYFINNKNKFLKSIYYSKNNITLFNNIYNELNNKPSIKVYKTDKDAVIQSKAFEEDAGYDLTIIKKIKDFNSKTTLYDTCIKIEIDEGYYTEIVPRSSISKFGYILANNIGIIDNHYRGNLMIALTKIADDAPDIELPFKCCQLIVRKQIYSDLYEITDDNLSSTLRNDGGFGSTTII